MKLFKNLFLILTLTAVIVSCKKDDDVPKVLTNSEKIIGTWEVTEYTDVKVVTNTLAAESSMVTTTSTGKLFDGAKVKFAESPKALTSTGDFVMVIKTKEDMEDEKTEEKKVDLETLFGSGTWVIENEEVLTIKRGEFDYPFKVIEITESSLKIEASSEVVITSGAAKKTTAITTTLAFKK